MTILESKIETYLCKQVELGGGFISKFVDPTRRGAPDRIVFMPWGCVYIIELKRPKGKAKVHQEKYHAMIRATGTNVYVLDTLEAIDSFFRMLA
jgi:hypothetical protein